MKTSTFKNLSLLTVAVTLTTVMASCGDSTEHRDADAMESTHMNSTDTYVDGHAAEVRDGETTQNEMMRDNGTTMMDGNEIMINGSAVGTPAYDERYAASKDVRGYRAMLMAELETIRMRLNDGTRDEMATKKDKERAADLAQGLERMDRLIVAVEESDDPTWTNIRSSTLKEASEVRVWANEHGYKLNA